MPQFQPIIIGDKTFTPDSISGTSASAQDLTQGLGKRDRLIFDRNVNEQNGNVYRRVVRVQFQRETADEVPRQYTVTGAFTLTFPSMASAADREEMLGTITGALEDESIKSSLVNPEWFF